MANIGNFEISLQAKFEGYQSELNKLKQAISRVGSDTELGKQLGKEFQKLEKDVENFSKHLTQRISSESQITRLTDQVNDIDGAFIKLGRDMQNVKVGDLKFDALTSSTQQLIKDLQSAQQALEKTFNQGFKEAASNSKELQDAFKILNIDPDKLSVDKIGTKLSSGLQTAQDALDKTNKKLDELKAKQQETQAELDKITNSPFGASTKDVTSESLFNQFFDISKARDNSKELENWLEDVQQKFITASQGIKNSSKKQEAQNLIESLIGITDPNEIRTKIESIVTIIKENSANLSNLRTAFGADGKRTANSIIESIVGSFDFKSLNTDVLKQQLQAVFDNFQGLNLSADKKQELLESVTGLTEDGIKAWSDKITAALGAFHKQTETEAANLIATLSKIGEAIAGTEVTQGEQQGKVNILQAGNNDYLKRIDELQGKVSKQQEEINNLTQKLEAALAQKDSGTVKAGEGATKSGAQGLLDNAKAAQQYAQQLERVKEAEKMVGKIEGIAQRWFSVYAAVNMVTKAISSMKSTIAELDKTITEIAIVTNMSQGDLWSQMDTYTAMAREYASSISGVYKVSQLYYQQGLQTKEVMELTEQTLKMARISGLDYAEATNYMTNAVRSFKMEMSDAQRVVDVYSAIAAKSATDVAELAVAMSKTASSAEAVGSSFENTTAMMAVMIEATRESSQNIGSAMKSIISRYGEMKADPSKMVDSEGEEMSLNKVDTALRSVGISIQNAQGQFRDFDDVIMELAEAWDTIDINTQRYIATVMAGNRQQSRFLALVSNGERLKQLSEEAANAENASQLQFLKTLDSIEAKSQQLQTSLQSLYTNSGLENFYKGILDISNAIVKTFGDMPTIFKLPIPAIISFGSTFYSLANVVTSVFSIIINRYAAHRSQLENLQKQNVVNSANIKEQEVKNFEAAEKRKTLIFEQEEKNRQRIAEGGKVINYRSGRNQPKEPQGEQGSNAQTNQRFVDTGALIANIAGLAATSIGTALKSSKNFNAQQAGGWASTLGQAASMGAMGFQMGGGVGAAVGTVAGLALGFSQNIDSIIQTTEKRLATFTEIANEAKNKALQEEAETSALESSIKKLEELKKSRYNSIEAEEAYLEASNAMAAQYPKLISGYDNAGNAIINLVNANQLLQSSLEKTAEATDEAAIANFKEAVAKKENEQDKLDKDFGIKTLNGLKSLGGIINTGAQQLNYNKETGSWHFINQAIEHSTESIIKQFANSAGNDMLTIGAPIMKQLGLDEQFKDKKHWTGMYNLSDVSFEEFFTPETMQKLEQATQTANGEALEYAQLLLTIGQEFTGAYSKLEPLNNEMMAIAQAGAASSIQKYIKSQKDFGGSEQKELFKNLDNAEELIQDIFIQGAIKAGEESTEKYEEYIHNGENKSNAYNQAKILYEALNNLGKLEDFNKLLADRAQLSKTDFESQLKELLKGTKLFDQVGNSFLSYYKDLYDISSFTKNIKSFDSSRIQTELRHVIISFGNSLTDFELTAINNQAEQIQQSITSGKITEKQGSALLGAYDKVWEELKNKENDITDDQRKAATQLLLSWDGTKEGLEGIITSLDGVKGATEIISAIRTLMPLVSQNLNTVFSQMISSVASEIKSMEDSFKDLSKGVEIDKAIEYANKLNISLSDFNLDYSTGLFTLSNTQLIVNKQVENIKKQIEKANDVLNKYTTGSAQEQFSIVSDATLRNFSTITDLSNEDNELVKEFNGFAGESGLEPGQLLSLIQEFYKQDDEIINQGFLEWLQSKFADDKEVLENLSKSTQARGALNIGDFSGFLKTYSEDIGGQLLNDIINSFINNGGVNIEELSNITDIESVDGLLDYIIQFSSKIHESVDGVAKNIYENAIKSISEGPQTITVDNNNKAYLEQLVGPIEEGITEVVINWSNIKTDAKAYQQKVNEILSTFPKETQEEMLKQIEEAVGHKAKAQAFDTLISSYDDLDASNLPALKEALGDTYDTLIHYNEELQKWELTSLQELRQVIIDSDVEQKTKNKQLAEIDKELRDTSVDTALREIGKSYNDVSEDGIRKLADSLGKDYNEIKDWFDYNDTTGKYSLTLAELQKHYNELAEKGDKAAAQVLQQIIDGYIEQLDKISEIQTSGYTKLGDMQNFANEIGWKGNLDSIYRWNDSLQAYVLNQRGIFKAAEQARNQLDKAKDSKDAEIQKQLIIRTKQNLASNIDAMGFINALQSGDTEGLRKSVIDFTIAVEDYNNYCRGLREGIQLDADTLKSMLASGGRAAVMAAQSLAAASGKTLSASDINTLYRSEIDKVNKAAQQLTYGVGEIIDANALAILKGVSNFHASEIANGQYVIDSVGDLVEAHEALYAAMRSTNEATTRELNAEWAKIQNLKSGGQTVEYLSQAAEMTYEAFGEALASVGIDAGNSDLSALYKDLGNGKIEITKPEEFLKLLGLSTEHTEAFISAYKELNNKIIENETKREEAINSEIQSLSDANGGDKLNLTTIYYEYMDRLDSETQEKFIEKLSEYGASFKQGILSLKDTADIPGIINYLREQLSDTDVLTEKQFANLNDALDTFLKNIVEQIKKGIQGTLTNTDKLNLQNALLGNYGIKLKEADFTKAENGLKLTEQAAIRVWNQLDKIDKVQARLVFKELSDSLKETNENYYSVSDVMNRISTLQEKINHADTKTSDARLKQYQEELAVAEEIAKVRATSKDESFDFMNGKLPDALENPLTYADNWGKAINILQKGSGDKKGFIDARDWYNIVNEMNNIAGIGENIKMYGVELDGSLEAASALIQKGYGALKSIDGGKMQVDLSQLGVSFEEGAMDMKGSVTEGIHAMAQSQIDMLDGLIAVLETVVAMQEAFDDFNTGEDNTIDLEDIFPKFKEGNTKNFSDDFKNASAKIIALSKEKGNENLKKALKEIKIDNFTLSELLEDASDGVRDLEYNYEAFTSIMNSFYQMGLSGDYDENNIYESVKKIAEQSGLGGEPFKIDLGTSTIFVNGKTTFRVDWEGEDFKTAIERYTQATGIPLTTEQAKKKVEEVLQQNPTEIVNMADFNLYAAFSPDITVRYDEKGAVSGWVVDGQTYNTQDAAKEALILKAEGAKLEKPITVDKETGEQKVTGKIGTDVEVEIIDKEKVYRYQGFTGNTLDEAIDAFIKANWDDRENGAITEEQLAEERQKIKIKSQIEPELEIKPPEDFKLTQDNQQKFMDLLASGKTIDGATIKENFGIDTGVTGELSADQIKQLTELFGVEYKPTVLKLSAETSEIDTKLSEILFGEGPINRTINITFGNGTDEGGQNTVNGIPNPLETEQIINIKGKLGDVNVTGEPTTVNAPGAKEADLTKGEQVIKTLVKTTAGEHEVNGDPTNTITTGSFDKADFSEGQGRIATAVKTAAGDLTVSGPATTENVDGLQDKVDSDTGVTVDAVSDELNVDATAVGKDNTYAATPLVVDSEAKPRVDAIANSFIVDLEKAIATPGFENQKDAVKYKGALKVLATALEWDIKDAEPKEGTEGKAETWVQKAQKQIKDIIGEVLQTDGNGNYVYTLEQAIGVLYSIGEWTEKVDENGKKQAATGQTPPQPEWPEGWCDDKGNLLDVKQIIQNYGITYNHDEKSDGEIPPLPQMENPPPQIITQEIIYQFVHKFKDEGEITKNINDGLGNGQIISDLQSKNDEQIKKYTNYLNELFTFKKQGGEFDESRINNIAELKRLMELADITETENYQKYFGKNGAFNVGTEKGEYTVSINPEINLENTSETEQNLVKEGNAESELETTIEDTIASNSSTIQDLFETGSATATLNVDINPNGKLPGEEGDDGSGDKGGKKDNTRTPVGGRITTTGNNNSDDTTKRNASGKKSSSKEEFHQATIETDVEMSTEGLSEPQQDLISKGETQTTMTIQQFAEQNGLTYLGQQASTGGIAIPAGEGLKQFNEVSSEKIDAVTESVQSFSETDAVNNPNLSINLGNLAKEALEICGVDVGHLQMLYHIFEDLPGAANTFMNDANWKAIIEIIRALNQSGNGKGLSGLLGGLFGGLFGGNPTPTSENPEGGENSNTDNKTEGKKEEEPEVIVGNSEITDMNGKPISEKAKQQWLNEGQPTEEVPTFDNITALTGGGTAPQFIGGYDSDVHRETPPEDETKTGEAKIDIDQANIETKGDTEFKAEGTVEQETPSPAPEAPEAPAAPEAPETPTETPQADTSGVEQLETAMTDMSAYAASAVEPINGVGSGLQTISSSASNLGSEAATIANNVSEAGNAATTAAGKLDELTGAINRIPSHTTIGIDAHVDLEVTASITEEKKGDAPAKGNADVDIKMGETSLSQSDFTISKAKGTNLALPKGNATTLMGELGPELYVSNGRYQVVGQNGAEFVDLPKDAIVFNHKKTAQLLKNGHMSGRGRPFTNISNALSFAKGSLEGGPAMASAAAALAALKQLRAMWASMLNASAKDLGSQAGRGGGGGGGKDENGNYKQPTNVIKDIERWYNLERQIANLEKEITYQQKLQAKYESDRVANGDKIFDAQKRQYDLLGREIIRQQELAKLQRSWYDNKRKELEESSYGKIFTYDENGLQQYVGTGKPGSGLGLDILENLTRRNVNGQAIGHAKTAKSQLKYLQSLGFDLNDLIYNDDGTKVVKKVGKNLRLTKMEGDEDTDDEELYAKMMENFWNNLDGWKDELDSLYDGIQDTLNEIEENQKKQNEIYQKWIDNDIDVRNKLRDAIVNREQAVIDKLQEQKDALEESTERFIDGLNDALEKDKQRSDENKADQELTKLQRQLSILQRSGGSAAQIKQLQDQISQKQEDMYFDERQKQIEAIQEASDKELERLDQQIELLTDTLDYQKENGLLWNEVELILQQGQEAATAFYAEWGIDQSQSALEQAENVRKIQEQFQKSDKFNEQKEKDQAEADWIDKIKNGKNAVTNANILGAMTPDDQKAAEERAKLAAQDAKEAHLKKNPGDEDGANKAAEDAYTKSLLDTYRETDAGKEVVKNFDSNYDTWLKNRQLSDINDFTNKEGFEKNKTTFKQAMEEYYLLHKNDKDENGNLIDENTLWKESIQAGQAAIHESLGESLKQEGTLSKSAAKYALDTNLNKFVKTTDTFPVKSVFNFDETRKAGSKNYLHIADYPPNEGWIRASQVKNGSNIVKLVKKGQDAIADESTADLSTAVVSGGDNDYYSSAAEASFILQGYTKKEIKDNWLGGTEFNKKGGGTIKASEKNNAVRISDVTGIKFKDKDAPEKGIKAAGKVIVDAIQPEGYSEMVELASTKPSSIGSGKQAKINSFINAKDSEMLRKIKYLMAYKEGGMAYATGPAWLDGTKTKPESVLNAKQTEFLKHDLLGSQNDSLMSIVHQLQDIYEQNSSNVSNISNNDIGTFIERIDVTFESGVIRDDYDMKRASNMFKNELLRIARKTTTVNVKRR